MKNNDLLKTALLFLFILNLGFSCEKVKVKDETIWVYNTKNDYSNNVPVELSKDMSKITSSPGSGEISTKWPVKLVNGYYLNGSFGPNSGYLSLTKEEYSNYGFALSVDSLYKLLIDKDPFVTFYERNDHNNVFDDENGAYGIDTNLINDLIIKDELNKYFERLK